MPTILEAAGIQAPDMINGAKQLPIDGISMAYTWDDAKAPTRRATQLFEMFGNRGIYHNGWMASTTPLVFAWEPEPKGITPESFNWELYDLSKDFSQGNDLAKAMPEKTKQMEELWWAEAGRNNALPLNFISVGDGSGYFPEAEPDPRAHALRLSPGNRSDSRGDRADGEEHVLHDHCQAQRARRRRRRRRHHAGRPFRGLGSGRARWQAGLGLQEYATAQ